MKIYYLIILSIFITDYSAAQVEVSGTGAGSGTNGLVIQADNCIIKGLIINNFDGSGIVIQNSSNNKITGNIIGTDNSSTSGIGNGENGISIINSSNNIIGEPVEDGINIIAGNSMHGIFISGSGSTDNKILSNYIGTDTIGTANIGNGGDGVCIVNNASNNFIGGDEEVLPKNLRKTKLNLGGISNVIANCTNGIYVNSNLNSIAGNLIGIFKKPGGGVSIPLGNLTGILIKDGENNKIFNSLIGANSSDGVRITGNLSKFNKLFSSIIGSDSSGTKGLGNLGNGVLIDSSASENSLGGCDSLLTLVANSKHALEVINSTLNKINGISAGIIRNIGINKNSSANINLKLGNLLGGFKFVDASSNSIGDPCAKNIIAANGGPGMIFQGAQTLLNKIKANIIGTDEEGSDSLGNEGDGICFMDDANENIIGGDNPDEANISVSNKGNGFAFINTLLNKMNGNYSGMFKNLSGQVKNLGNNLSGVLIKNSQQTEVGKGIFSGNLDGIRITGQSSILNRIYGIITGTDSNASQGLGNSRFGIFLDSLASNNILGGFGKDSSIISGGNQLAGIYLKQSNQNKIFNTLSGVMKKLNQTSMTIIKNLGEGVVIEDSENNEFGSPEMPNIVAGNGKAGLAIKGIQSILNKVKSSFFGTDTSGSSGLGNSGDGVLITDGANDNIIGGENSGEGNISVDNGKSGFAVTGQNTKGNGLIGNLSGIFKAFNIPTKPLGNSLGFLIQNAIETTIKNSTFAANKFEGGKITGPFASLNKIFGCRFGTDSSLSLNLGNLKGLLIENGANNNVIGDVNSLLKNFFSGNKEWGMIVSNSYNNNIYNGIFGSVNKLNNSLKNLVGGIKFVNASNNSLGRPSGGLSGIIGSIGNLIEGHDSAGVAIINSSNIQVAGNDILKNQIGVLIKIDSTLINILQQLNVINNKVIQNIRAFEGTNSDLYIAGNIIEDNSGIATGIHLYNSTGKIAGNIITGDAGDGITLEDGSNPLIYKNNIYNNSGFGIRNFDQSVFVNAQENWWGDASGPSGNGSGSGDEVSMGIDFTNWKNSLVSLVASAGRDTLFVLPGSSDTVEVFITNFQDPSDIVNISLSDQLGWLTGEATQQIDLSGDSLGAAIPVYLNIPSSASENSINKVLINAASQLGSGETDSDSFYVSIYQPQLTNLFVAPDTITLGLGETYQFNVFGFDQAANSLSINPQWDATGGTIDTTGFYTAGNIIGNYSVTATDPITQLQDNAVVIITITTDIEESIGNLPDKFILYQNYPNPFNPSTIIKYGLPFESKVSVKIYNILGEVVQELINSVQLQGFHSLNWNASGLASGIYIYKIEAESLNDNQNFISIKKMILLK